MVTIITKWLVLIFLSFLLRSNTLILSQQVPCYFIFGDSLSDNGNNNDLISYAKANYRPYGIDYPGAVPTGRFSNGKIITDFLAQLLGFSDPIPPFVTTRGSAVLKGLNYASGASGILDSSGALLGQLFSMNEQLVNHVDTIGQIACLLGSRPAADNYLRQCLYTVNIGTNDYINNYYQQPPSPYSLLSPEIFAKELIKTFSQQLKIVQPWIKKKAVYGVGLIGCMPQEIKLYPITNGSPCVDSINNAVTIFNNMLFTLIKDLNTNLPDARFTYINSTSIALGDPALAGVKVMNAPCCEVDKRLGLCARNGSVCSNRDEYIFFDNIHPTEIVDNAMASRSYKALLPEDAFPVDIQHLVAVKDITYVQMQ